MTNFVTIFVAIWCVISVEPTAPDVSLLRPFLFNQNGQPLHLASQSRQSSVVPKIIGGVRAQGGTTKYQVSIRLRMAEEVFGNGHICGGTLISYTTVLTAAHCLFFFNEDDKEGILRPAIDFVLVMGTMNRYMNTPTTLSFLITHYKYHDDFSTIDMRNDIALMFLSGEVPLDYPTVQPIALTSGCSISIKAPSQALQIKQYFIRADTKVAQQPRIIGGTVANINTAPYQASIRWRSLDVPFGRGHICGGSLITQRAVLTAAHCFYYSSGFTTQMFKASDLSVVMGSLNLRQITATTFESLVRQYTIHKQFNDKTLKNDIAVIILYTLVPANHPTVKPVGLAAFTRPDNTTCLVSGWGATRYNGSPSDQLLAANVSLIPYSLCSSSYPLETGMICAGDWNNGSRDACQGDSGGPLFCQGQLYGVVSWGYQCGERWYPGVYTSVPYYLNWILYNHSSKVESTIAFVLLPVYVALWLFK